MPPVDSGATATSGSDPDGRRGRHDLSDLLDQLHEELHVEPSAAPFDPDAPLTDPRDLERPVTETIVIESTGGLDFRPNFATFGTRFVGAAIDGLALTVAMVPGALILLQTSGGTGTLLGLVALVVGFVAANVWYARSVARTGQWFGNRVTKTKVVSATNGANIDAGFAFLRFAARHLVSVILLIGFLVAFTDSQRRTFHDRMAGSVVVGRARATWSADDDAA
jgi:uncharacterized RDD family membrane protein YckC